MTLRRIFFN